MKNWIGAAAVAMAFAGAADAAVINGSATFTDVFYQGDASVFAALGIDVTTDPTPDMIFRWSHDTASTPYLTDTVSNAEFAYDEAFLPYLSFTVEIAGVTIAASTASNLNNRIFVRDGTFDAPGGTDYILDNVQVGSFDDQAIGTTGVTLDYMYFYGASLDEGVISGTGYPDAGEWAGLFDNSPGDEEVAQIRLFGPTGATGRLVVNAGYSGNGSIGIVPLPAGLPLLAGGLLALGLMRRRRGAA